MKAKVKFIKKGDKAKITELPELPFACMDASGSIAIFTVNIFGLYRGIVFNNDGTVSPWQEESKSLLSALNCDALSLIDIESIEIGYSFI